MGESIGGLRDFSTANGLGSFSFDIEGQAWMGNQYMGYINPSVMEYDLGMPGVFNPPAGAYMVPDYVNNKPIGTATIYAPGSRAPIGSIVTDAYVNSNGTVVAPGAPTPNPPGSSYPGSVFTGPRGTSPLGTGTPTGLGGSYNPEPTSQLPGLNVPGGGGGKHPQDKPEPIAVQAGYDYSFGTPADLDPAIASNGRPKVYILGTNNFHGYQMPGNWSGGVFHAGSSGSDVAVVNDVGTGVFLSGATYNWDGLYWGTSRLLPMVNPDGNSPQLGVNWRLPIFQQAFNWWIDGLYDTAGRRVVPDDTIGPKALGYGVVPTILGSVPGNGRWSAGPDGGIPGARVLAGNGPASDATTIVQVALDWNSTGILLFNAKGNIYRFSRDAPYAATGVLQYWGNVKSFPSGLFIVPLAGGPFGATIGSTWQPADGGH